MSGFLRLCTVLHRAALLLIDLELSTVIRHVPLSSEALLHLVVDHLPNLICRCHGLRVEGDDLTGVPPGAGRVAR